MVQAVVPTTVTGLQGRPVASTPAPTNNQALIWNGSAWVPGGPYLTAAGAPYIATNYVDNSGFIINQRGYASGAALAAGAYGFDRWKGGSSGCTLTFTASPAMTVVTIAAGTLVQIVEGLNLINSSYTLSWVGSATGRVNTGAFVASPITFTGAPNTNVSIEFQGGTLSQIQLQLGTQATLWQPRPVSEEWTRCMRFLVVGVSTLMAGYAAASGMQVGFALSLPVPMRAAGTITLQANNHLNISTFSPAVVSAYAGQVWLSSAAAAAGQFVINQSLVISADL